MEATTTKKLALSDLKIGMEVTREQLSDIYDTWIILIKKEKNSPYKIGFIGKETNAESQKLFNKGNIICPVYNDSLEAEGDIYFDE